MVLSSAPPAERGLTRREAARRLVAYGPNELQAQRRRSPWRDVVDQLVHPLALLLWLAAALSLVTGSVTLAAAVVLVILLNAGFAFIQERQSERAVEALSAYLPQTAVAVRDGEACQVPARELVPGDVILVVEGDRICADARLLEGSLEIDTSTLTGEALPVLRAAADHHDAAGPPRRPAPVVPSPALEAMDLVFSGTACTGGQARAVVLHTGMHTELGRIAALTQRVTRDPSPLERQVRRVAWLIAAVAVVAALAFIPIGALAAGLSLTGAAMFAIGLLVANVPEGLLPTITLALAAGVRELAHEGALVKRLSAVETLGSTSVICTDKTGTLTLNRMRAVLAWSLAGETTLDADVAPPPREHQLGRLAATMAACNTADLSAPPGGPTSGDPTDLALLGAAGRLGAATGKPDREARRRHMFHFDPQLRLMTTVDAPDGADAGAIAVVHTKGAPEEVLARCVETLTADGTTGPLDEVTRARIETAVEGYASRGLRLLAAADRVVDTADPALSSREGTESGLTWLGVVALLDPPRPEVAEAIGRCHTAGIRVIVVTGDHPQTAGEIARRVGIGGQHPHVINASDLGRMSEADLDALLATHEELVFARSSPETKMRITDALQDAGHVVAMTGDGVNDAPALRRADIGVAMGLGGTDVAREASTMVLTDDDFATIVRAVEAGRRVYDNVRKFILYIFAHATPEVVPFLVFALSGGRVPLPLTVLQILAIDVGTETLPALALGRERAEPGSMERPPRSRSESIITRRLLLRAWLLLGGVSAVLVTGGFFAVLLRGGWSPGADVSSGPLHQVYLQATTMCFLGIVACQVGTAFAARTERASLWRTGPLSNRLLLAGIGFELLFAAAVTTAPGLHTVLAMAAPPLWALGVLPGFAVAVWAPDELVRAVERRRLSRAGRGGGPGPGR